MLKNIKPKSEFSKNVLTLMTGTTVAQIIPILISPILTRLYSPEDFGIFALYISIVTIISVIATGQYELAVMLPKKNVDSLNILFLSIILNFIISMLLFVIIIFFNNSIADLLNNKGIGKWLYLIPFSVFLLGLFNCLNYWFNRNKNYKLLAKAKILKSSVNAGSNLSLGFLSFTASGLIISNLLSQLINILIFLKNFNLKRIKLFSIKKILVLSKQYAKFPKITLPHSIFSSLSQNLPVFMLTKFFTSADVGFYSFGNRIVLLPISLISTSYYQVFFQSFKDEQDKLKFYKQKFKQVNLIFIPLFLGLWFILPDIFSIIFSEKWRIAGEYSRILLPLFYMKFLSNLFTTTTYIYYQKQEENFLLGMLISLLTFISLMIGVYFNNIKIALFSMMIANSLVIVFKLHRSLNFVRENIKC